MKVTCEHSGIEFETNSEKWEAITISTLGATDRLKVPGGWLYRISHQEQEIANIAFVPEPDKRDRHGEYMMKACQSCIKDKYDSPPAIVINKHNALLADCPNCKGAGKIVLFYPE